MCQYQARYIVKTGVQMGLIFFAILGLVTSVVAGWLLSKFLALPAVILVSVLVVVSLCYVWWKETRPNPRYRGSGAIGAMFIGVYITLCVALGMITMWSAAIWDTNIVTDFWSVIRPYILK